ncbi:NAD-dependent epimerase/dehydratase family protein [Mycolicibacterium flavescens]|uniref:NAD-dependent epimerase/dehydratase domain-containing protein n=1 Tax=Mycolicibacterium flavescens TaxID=1776 RepID=A0A1E3RJZ3_MYCFV|nr:NAD-dependent epimerase/dehydratase family protein [Mycolicibacterium flavescens]MCV7282583.1 NAD-dependent epimerase/dehydratase family protein [Mycolicibacterium flavescens]ODQ90205.1 hypothetical protein BHQ18_12300 [Mycolicibacterium flavescens]
MRVLITGAAGFIGATLVDRLLSDGHQVIGVDNLSTGHAGNLDAAIAGNGLGEKRFTLISLDIQAPELVDIVDGTRPQVIYHLAAQTSLSASLSNPEFDARSNILGTINLCEASRSTGVRRIVYAAYGLSGTATTRPQSRGDVAYALHSPHVAAKLAAELYLHAYGAMYGLAPISLRLANIYGPRQRQAEPGASIAAVASAMINGSQRISAPHQELTLDYVYIDDAVDAFVCAGAAPLDVTGTYSVGSGRLTDASEVDESIRGAVRDTGAIPPNGDARELGWRPNVDLAEGIARTVRWLDESQRRSPAEAYGAVGEDQLAVAG